MSEKNRYILNSLGDLTRKFVYLHGLFRSVCSQSDEEMSYQNYPASDRNFFFTKAE